MVWVAILVGGAVVICATIAVLRHRRFWPLWALEVAVVGPAHPLAKWAESTDYHDADGWIDCSTNCTAIQDAVGATLFAGLPLLGFLVVAGLIRVTRRRTGCSGPGTA
jgi:hypothetical protein